MFFGLHSVHKRRVLLIPAFLITDKCNYQQRKVYQGRIAARGWFFQVGLVYGFGQLTTGFYITYECGLT